MLLIQKGFEPNGRVVLSSALLAAELSDPVLAHIIKPASGLDCFLLLYYHCVSFTMYVVLLQV